MQALLAFTISMTQPHSDYSLKHFHKKQIFVGKTIRYLRVAVIDYEPFLYSDESLKFYNGVEYKLLKTIAEKEHLGFEILSEQMNMHWTCIKYYKDCLRRKKCL